MKILPECPAPVHNTLDAAYGRSTKHAFGERREHRAPKCICPGALQAREETLAKRREAKRAPRPSRAKRTVVSGPAGAWVPDGVHVPDLSKGFCQTEVGRAAHDRAVSSSSFKAAQDACSFCPEDTMQACREYVLKADPKGDWKGVFGGLAQHERRAIARRREKSS